MDINKESVNMTIKDIEKDIKSLRDQYGNDICTDAMVHLNTVMYRVMPDDVTGYIMEVDLDTGKSRHKGNGVGCFWTEWEE